MKTTINNETNRKRVMEFIAGLRLDGRSWAIQVERRQHKRSLPQNALLHLWLAQIARETGNTQADVKEAYREMFLPKVPVRLGDEDHLVGRSTTKLSKAEMGEFLDQIHAHAAQELGIMLPLPEELWYDEEGHGR